MTHYYQGEIAIPKHLEKLVFDCVGFASDFLFKAHAVSISTAIRLE